MLRTQFGIVGRAAAYLIVAGGVSLGLVAAARGDVVVLKDGTRLTGQIVTLQDGKLTVHTPSLGDVKLDAGQVQTFGSTRPLDLKLVDGTQLTRTVDTSDDGSVGLEPSLLSPGQQVRVADVAEINPPPPAITGSITAGALLVRGNTQTDSLNIGLNLAYKTERDTVAVTGSYLYGRTRDRTTGVVTTTAENWQVEARNDYFFTKPFYTFQDVQVRKDRISDLDLRLVPSAGLGYVLMDYPDFKFSAEAGLAFVYERYTNDTPTREDFAGRVAYHLTKKFNDKVSAFHDLEYLPSFASGRRFIINTDLGLHAGLTTHLFTEAKITLDYDASPANGALKTNVFYAISLGYNF